MYPSASFFRVGGTTTGRMRSRFVGSRCTMIFLPRMVDYMRK